MIDDEELPAWALTSVFWIAVALTIAIPIGVFMLAAMAIDAVGGCS